MEGQIKKNIDPMVEALVMDNEQQIDCLINQGVDPNDNLHVKGKKFKNKPLHYAAYYNSVKAAKKLIAAGADISCVNGMGATPLQVAEINDAFNVLELLKRFKQQAVSKKRIRSAL